MYICRKKRGFAVTVQGLWLPDVTRRSTGREVAKAEHITVLVTYTVCIFQRQTIIILCLFKEDFVTGL
jgi:hypothetical protein